MSFAGAAEYGGRRAVGVLLGCNLALAIQLLHDSGFHMET